jgi:hypothetical protein
MSFNLMGFILAKTAAEGRGVTGDEATRAGLLGMLMGKDPIRAVLFARIFADGQATSKPATTTSTACKEAPPEDSPPLPPLPDPRLTPEGKGEGSASGAAPSPGLVAA